MRVAVMNIRPNFCPDCGRAFRWTPQELYDYSRRFHFQCARCRFLFQLAESQGIIAAAKHAGGDLGVTDGN